MYVQRATLKNIIAQEAETKNASPRIRATCQALLLSGHKCRISTLGS